LGLVGAIQQIEVQGSITLSTLLGYCGNQVGYGPWA